MDLLALIDAPVELSGKSGELPMQRYTPHYVAYAHAHGRTPAAMLAHDRDAWPGGRMAGFMVWMSERRREWLALRRWERDAILDEEDERAYDAWLLAWRPAQPHPFLIDEPGACRDGQHSSLGGGCPTCDPETHWRAQEAPAGEPRGGIAGASAVLLARVALTTSGGHAPRGGAGDEAKHSRSRPAPDRRAGGAVNDW